MGGRGKGSEKREGRGGRVDGREGRGKEWREIKL